MFRFPHSTVVEFSQQKGFINYAAPLKVEGKRFFAQNHLLIFSVEVKGTDCEIQIIPRQSLALIKELSLSP